MCYNQKGATHDLLTCEQRLMCQRVAGKDTVVLDKKVNIPNAYITSREQICLCLCPGPAPDPAPALSPPSAFVLTNTAA